MRTRIPESERLSATILVDLEIEFAGQTAHYKQVQLQLATQSNEIRISGAIPARLSDFKIEPPSRLAIPVKNDIPVQLEMTWHQL